MTRSLASVIAYDSDASVVVVDLNWTDPKRPDSKKPSKKADPAKPADADDHQPTLVDAIENKVDVDLIIRPTSNSRLSLVAAGAIARPRRTAMAGSRGLAAALDDIAKRFDHVLLDLPPVLASADAITLSQLADAYLLVVQQGITATSQIEAALEELPGETLGVILNRFDTHVPRSVRRMVGS